MTRDDTIKLLFDLGEPDIKADWPDYLQYGFDEADVPVLLELVTVDTRNHADAESNAIWVPLHAWRTLGQIGSDKAITPLIGLFDQATGDNYALVELPRVLAMIGKSAIVPLGHYLRDSHHDELARSMAVDALDEIVNLDHSCRNQVIKCFKAYMSQPDESARYLNGLLVCCLIDLKAKDTIDDIRQLYQKNCVDSTTVGDLEDIEIELGIRTQRSSPKPDAVPILDTGTVPDLATLGSSDTLSIVNYYLNQYGNDHSLEDVSALDGFFTALACTPETIVPSRWMPAIWGGEALAPEWETEAEFEEYSRALFELYNNVMESIYEHEFEPLYLINEIDNRTYYIVDVWCRGFLRGLELSAPFDPQDTAFIEKNTQSIRSFALEQSFERMINMSQTELLARNDLIEIDVLNVWTHSFEKRQTVTHDQPKVGRDDPCPCGSGKKYKKCCLH